MSDEYYMGVALNMARRGLGRVGQARPSVGCVLVKDGRIIARARTGDGGAPHAEAATLALAGAQASGATAFVTLEPCAHHGRTPPCAAALIGAGIKRCVVACLDPFDAVNGEGVRQLRAAGIEVSVGILEAQTRRINAGFFSSVMQQRPFVTLKCATTSDEKITAGEGASRWITGERARLHGHWLRSAHDAIAIGIGTAVADDPLLTTRLPGLVHKGARIVFDRHLKLPSKSLLVRSAKGQQALWVLHEDDPEDRAGALRDAGCVLVCVPNLGDLKAVLAQLAGMGVTRLLVEGGARLMGSFAAQGSADQFYWYKSPRLSEKGGLPALEGGGSLATMAQNLGLGLQETRNLGEDLLEIYRPSA